MATYDRKRASANNQALVRYKLYEAIDNAVKYIPKYGFLAFAAWCGKEVLVSYAGKTTIANVHIVGNLTLSAALHWGATAGLGVWAVAERKAKQRAVSRLAPRAGELERILDDKRTSSNLTRQGKTRKEDRI